MRLYLLLIIIFSVIITEAQRRYNFSTLGIEQGLSNANIWSINQDKYGYIWIATVNGLNRYDGHTIKQYFNRPGDSSSLAGNSIFWIFKDSDGDMWFACGGGGMSKYNYAADAFESLPQYDSARKHNKYNSPVWRFGEDAQKRIYFSCGGACYRYDKQSKKFNDLTPLFGPQWDYGIGCFYMQGKNTMWIATDNGLFKYDIANEKMRKIAFDVQKFAYGSSAMYDIEFINDKEILIPIERGSYVIMNVLTEKFRPADDQFNPAVTSHYNETGDFLKDSKGRFWIGNTTYGLLRYFPDEGNAIMMKNEPGYPYPYVEQEGQGKTLFEDSDGDIWFGTSTQGAVRFHPDFDFIHSYRRDYSKQNSLPDDKVFCFYHSDANGVFLGTGRGLCQFNRTTQSYYSYAGKNMFDGPFKESAVKEIAVAGDTIFMATSRGLVVYNQHTKTFKRYYVDTATASPNSIAEDNLRRVFVVQPGEIILIGNGIARFMTSTGKFYYRKNTPSDSLYMLENVTTAAFDKQNKKLWIGINSNDLYEYEVTTKRLRHHYLNNRKDTIGSFPFYTLVASGAEVWAGTAKGLVKYSTLTGKSALYTLPQSTTKILNILPDGNVVWFTTTDEVCRLNLQTKHFESFSIAELMPNATFYPRSIKQDNEGNLWLGSDRGFCIVYKDRFMANTISHAPQLVNFKVFNDAKLFEKPLSEVNIINLAYEENFFSFDFSTLQFIKQERVQYQYKLEGFDKEWRTSLNNSASYTNVPPGTYTLHFRTQRGNDASKEGRPIQIKVAAPFWRTWWFISACLLIMAWSTWRLYKQRIKMKRKRNIDKTIDYFANSMYGQNSVNEICWDIARNCISQLELEDCVVYLYDEKKQALIQKAAFGPKSPKGHEIVNPLEIKLGEGIVGTVGKTCKPLLIKNTKKDGRYILDDEERMSELAVPISHEGELIGVIDSEHSKENFFTADHQKALTTIASISSNKIAEAKAEALAKENELQLLEINKLLAESQLMALRTQMNPHFVFNCLNSIQECIVTEKYPEAIIYLSKFSKLFRSILNNSGKVYVTLQEEIEVLELYLVLEHMRFEKSFSYEIILDEELDKDEIELPSMLLQPYVENALWHGLMHKQGEKKLKIEFKSIDEETFSCIIDDNGIGRKKSFELKEQQSKTRHHQSKGMRITKDRIDLLKRQGNHAELQILDKEENGLATGTTVIIELSAYLK